VNNEEINRKINELYTIFTRKHQIDLRNPTIEEFFNWIESKIKENEETKISRKDLVKKVIDEIYQHSSEYEDFIQECIRKEVNNWSYEDLCYFLYGE